VCVCVWYYVCDSSIINIIEVCVCVVVLVLVCVVSSV
jgi:hypothetical protein